MFIKAIGYLNATGSNEPHEYYINTKDICIIHTKKTYDIAGNISYTYECQIRDDQLHIYVIDKSIAEKLINNDPDFN